MVNVDVLIIGAWTAGDVTGMLLFTFAAGEQGKTAVMNAVGGKHIELNYDISLEAEASSLIHEVVAAVAGDMSVSDIGNTLYAYPTLSEGVRYACQAIM